MSSYNGNNNVSPYINESLIEASTYTISENDKFVFSVTNPIPGTNAVMSINDGGYTTIMAVNGVFSPLESTTFDKNVDIPITLNILNSVTSAVITSLSLNIRWGQITFSPIVIKASQNNGTFTMVAENSTLTQNLNDSLRFQVFTGENITRVGTEYSLIASRYSNFPSGGYNISIANGVPLNDNSILIFDKTQFYPEITSTETIYFRARISEYNFDTDQIAILNTFIFSVVMN